jgi:hypothetical protein
MRGGSVGIFDYTEKEKPDNMNPNRPSDAADLAARIQLLHAPVRAALIGRILGLSENAGMTDHAIAAVLDLPLALVQMVIRGSGSDRSSRPRYAISAKEQDE